MKMKTWLMTSYLLIMSIPLLILFMLLIMVQSWDEKKDISDYLSVQSKLTYYESVLENPILYGWPDSNLQRMNELKRLEGLSQTGVRFVLYDSSGTPLFSAPYSPGKQLSSEEMFQDLYELKAGYQTFQYKKPVIMDNETIGFYMVIFPRDEWISGVQFQKNVAILLFVTSFLILYGLSYLFLKKKLLLPIRELLFDMDQFAKGHSVQKRSYHGRKDEIGELFQGFSSMQDEIVTQQAALLEQQKQKEYIAASIAHDIKTPLTSIRASAEQLTLDKQTEWVSFRSTILEKSDYIHGLIDDLSIYTILQGDEYELPTIKVDAGEFFEMLLSGYEELAIEHRILFTTTVIASGNVYVHPNQLIRVIDNLISNAFNHVAPNGKVWAGGLTTQYTLPEWIFGPHRNKINITEKQQVLLIVQNEGEFVPHQDIEKLFEPLYQRDPSRTNRSSIGSGLGLSIVKSIIEKHGGTISFLSTEGYGSTVICHLPLATEVD
ncbi:sensor histidine kinase [Peribacillus alkalitolerans]|uniref:sensor histidine kinase n=1 Tax=Peribacillus alkalitolerans TaxID=1550385 RepID=UPI0013CF7117|nr:HAMP domain-containing sensor histidine kinase [Peribacillus alkalitolerans]